MKASEVAAILDAVRLDPVLFNEIVLRRPPYWSRQQDICRSFLSHRTTAVQAANGVGKSYVAAGLLLYALLCFPNSKVLSTAPSNQLLVDVLWSEVRQAWSRCIFRDFFGTDIKSNPQRLTLTDGWEAVGWSSDSTAKMSGRHRGDLIWVVDEASDVDAEVWKGIHSTNPSKMLVLGNPLRLDNDFHKLCTGENPQVNKLIISALDNPDIGLDRSTRGMSDATWLQGIRYTYGEGSPYWTCHVEGRFNKEDDFQLVPTDWVDNCAIPHPGRRGPVRIGVDLSKGVGGTSDNSVIVVFDDAGILDLDWANTWALETTAQLVVHHRQQWDVEPSRVVYDGTGLGLGFGNFLEAAGLHGARAYIGTSSLRSASAWKMRLRLDPGRTLFPKPNPRARPKASLNHLFTGGTAPVVPVPHKQAPFAIDPRWHAALRPELLSFRYSLAPHGGIVLEAKDALKKRLGRSPDLADSWLIGLSIT